MFIAFVKDYREQRVQIACNTPTVAVEAAFLGMMQRYRDAFQSNASILASMEQVGSVKPQEAYQLGWAELSAVSTDGSVLDTKCAMHMFKVGQEGQLYKTAGYVVFVGPEFVTALAADGIEKISDMARLMAEAGVSYSAEDGRLTPVQVMALTLAIQCIGMDPTESVWPTTSFTADIDGVPAIVVPTNQMTFCALTHSTMKDQARAQFAGAK